MSSNTITNAGPSSSSLAGKRRAGTGQILDVRPRHAGHYLLTPFVFPSDDDADARHQPAAPAADGCAPRPAAFRQPDFRKVDVENRAPAAWLAVRMRKSGSSDINARRQAREDDRQILPFRFDLRLTQAGFPPSRGEPLRHIVERTDQENRSRHATGVGNRVSKSPFATARVPATRFWIGATKRRDKNQRTIDRCEQGNH